MFDGTIGQAVLLEDKSMTIETEPDCGLVFLTLCGVRGEDGLEVDVGFDIDPEKAMELSVALAKAAAKAAENLIRQWQPSSCATSTS